VPNARFLRVVSFHPTGPEAPVDSVLREAIVPALLRRDEVIDAWIGRQGEKVDRSRVLASTWAADPGPAPADVAALEDPDLAHGASTVSSVEQRVLAVRARFDRPDPARILRIFRGHVRAGEMDAYVEEARTGMLADAAVNEGLIAFSLGLDPPDDFLTVSAWTGWAAIEAATGGNTRQPFVTRNTARLAGFAVAHFEILPETPDRRVPDRA
jgi:hypothetical protein